MRCSHRMTRVMTEDKYQIKQPGRPKVAIGHLMIGRAGSESNVMWLIEALKRDCDVTVVTTRG